MNLDFDTSIFDSQFFQILSKIKKQIKKQNQQNKTISPNRGASTDFFIHRPYLLGDDIRKIDWNIYARFQEWIIKENHQENHINWWLLWDISASMQPPKYKISAQIIGFFHMYGSITRKLCSNFYVSSRKTSTKPLIS